jgi:peptidoglycan/xylan/chitin deacetylase (PgdA/CDA1 family)
MRWLKRLGFQGLSMTDLMPYLKGDRAKSVFGITFDDGYLNNLEHALPVLKSLDFTATCYVVHDEIGSVNRWDQNLGIEQVPLMNLSEIRTWIDAGMEVGSHTRTHPHLNSMDSKSAWKEIHESKCLLEDALNSSVRHFCYPYGEYSIEHVGMTQRAGYETATTTRRGRVSSGCSLWEMPRVPVQRSTSAIQLLWKMMTHHEDRRSMNS